MPRFVALDWDDQEVRAVFANLQGGTITVDDAVSLPLGADRAKGEITLLTEVIRQSVSDHRYRSAEALITIRRADVELRLLALPEVPEDELPDIVRFQALRDFSEISEDWPIDYLHVSQSAGEMMVLAAAVPKSRVDRFRSAVEASDLKPKSLVLRPCAAGSIATHQANIKHEDVQLMVDEFGTGIELTVLKNQAATFIRTVQRPTESNRVNHLAGEIRRTIVAAQNQMGGDRVQQVILFGAGPEHEANCRQLEERLELTVTGINPFAGLKLNRDLQQQLPETPGRFAATLGLLVNQNEPTAHVLDFLNPRRVEAPRSKQPLAIAAIAGTASILLLIAGGCWWYLYSLDQKILELQRTSQGLSKSVESAQTRIDEYRSMAEWMRGDINWLEEMRDISTKLPPPHNAKVREFRANVAPSGDGIVVLEGLVDDQGTISAIERNLRDERHRIRGEGGLYERQDEKYPWRFRETVVIETAESNVNQAPTSRRRGTIPRRSTPNRVQQP